jgi:hypothetical protein
MCKHTYQTARDLWVWPVLLALTCEPLSSLVESSSLQAGVAAPPPVARVPAQASVAQAPQAGPPSDVSSAPSNTTHAVQAYESGSEWDMDYSSDDTDSSVTAEAPPTVTASDSVGLLAGGEAAVAQHGASGAEGAHAGPGAVGGDGDGAAMDVNEQPEPQQGAAGGQIGQGLIGSVLTSLTRTLGKRFKRL